MEYLIGLLLGITGNLIAYDISTRYKKWCRALIESACKRLPEHQQAARMDEWLAHLNDTDGLYQCFRHAIGCWFAVPSLAANAPTAQAASAAAPLEDLVIESLTFERLMSGLPDHIRGRLANIISINRASSHPKPMVLKFGQNVDDTYNLHVQTFVRDGRTCIGLHVLLPTHLAE